MRFVCERDNGQTLVKSVQHANHFWSRLRGLLGKKILPLDQGLLIEPCNSVHSLGMKFSIAVIYLSKDNQILHLIPELAPGKLGPVIRGSSRVLELHPQALPADLQTETYLRFIPHVQ